VPYTFLLVCLKIPANHIICQHDAALFSEPATHLANKYALEQEPNTPQQATGHGLACSFRPKGRGIQPSRHSPNIRASAAAWLIARGNKKPAG